MRSSEYARFKKDSLKEKRLIGSAPEWKEMVIMIGLAYEIFNISTNITDLLGLMEWSSMQQI